MAENEHTPVTSTDETTDKRLANLRPPWKPGTSGNPGGLPGRPKRKWLTEVTEELLEERLSDPKFREEYKCGVWRKLLSDKVVGSMTLEKVWERTEGKVAQQLDVNFSDVGMVLEEVRKRKAEEDAITNSDKEGEAK